MNLQKQPPAQRRAERKKKHTWAYVVIALVFFLAAGLGALFASSGLMDKKEDTPAEEGLLVAHDKATIMIMGVDERDDDVGRSDTLMVAALDPKNNQASLLSVPRDTRVKIKGHGWDKINAAYAYGGEKLTQRTVEDFLGLNIDHYVIINTKSFVKIIDALGGIDVDVEKRMYYEDPWDDDGGLLIDLKPGLQHMDGKTAVTYVRYRDEEGDIGRIRRQQKFMKACMDKLVSPSTITSLPSIIKEVMGSIKTDMSLRQILEFAGTLKESQKNGLKTDMVPGKPLYIDGVSYWIPSIKELRNSIADTLGLQMNAQALSDLSRTELEYKNSIPSTAKEVPASDHSIGKASSYNSSKHSASSESDRKASTPKETKRTESSSSKEDSTPSTPSTREAAPQKEPATAPREAAPAPAVDTTVPTQGGGGGKTQ